MIRQSRKIDRINEIMNHPEIHPWVTVGGRGKLDFSKQFHHPVYLFLEGEFGCFIVHRIVAGIGEFHTAVLPEGRGSWGMDFFQAGLDWVFTNTEIVELITQCPKNNPATKAAVRMMHFDYQFTTPEKVWESHKGPVECDIYGMTIQKWSIFTDSFLQKGRDFHQNLRTMIELKPENDDHDRYMGAFLAMTEAGYPKKAESFYNRWAIMSRYDPISVLSYDPLILDVQRSKIQIKKNKIEVLKCPQQPQS